MAIGIIAAVPAEARAWARLRAGGCFTDADGHRIALSGMGAERAAATAARLLADDVDALVSWGSAAGLDPALAAGTLVLPTAIRLVSGERLPVDSRWQGCVAGQLATTARVSTDLTLADTATILTDSEAKSALRKRTGAAVADMETAAVADRARGAGVPFIAVRAVTDDAFTVLPPAALAAIRPDGRSAPFAMLGALVGRPRLLHAQLRALKQLSAGFTRAQNQLASARPAVLACAPKSPERY